MTRIGGWLVVALIAVGIFLAGRWSVVPDDQELRDSLAVYREHRKQDKAALDSSKPGAMSMGSRSARAITT
jgi:hypothetical protein